MHTGSPRVQSESGPRKSEPCVFILARLHHFWPLMGFLMVAVESLPGVRCARAVPDRKSSPVTIVLFFNSEKRFFRTLRALVRFSTLKFFCTDCTCSHVLFLYSAPVTSTNLPMNEPRMRTRRLCTVLGRRGTCTSITFSSRASYGCTRTERDLRASTGPACTEHTAGFTAQKGIVESPRV